MGNIPSSLLDDLSEGTNFGSEEIDRLAKRFMKLDTDNSGAIDKDEFLAIPGIGQNPLAKRVVDIFDENKGGDIDFKEFVTGLSVFSSTGSVDDKLRFLFKVYDIDNDGYISNGELFIVLRLMVADSLNDVQLQQLVDRTIMEGDSDGDGKLSFAEFKKIIESTSDITQKLSLDDKI
jgi:serine/threonine-protein phosphatase 2B regulatory subunit